jgi:hypothetical protein
VKSEQIMHKKATNFIKRTLGLSVLSVAFFGIQSVKAECWEEAAAMYGHDPYLLKAIGWKESRGHVGAVGSLLKDGNRALGLMQINTIHLPRLNKLGIHRSDLFDPCTSQKVGAWVLADCLKKKGDIWVAVGCYYGGPASRAYTAMRGYATDVRRYYEGYKRQAGLPAVYQPLIGYQAQPELPNPMANNENKQVVAYQNQSETPISNSRIIQF